MGESDPEPFHHYLDSNQHYSFDPEEAHHRLLQALGGIQVSFSYQT